ncbi:hypothetical protein EYM_05050 [Ignicoccus islandicus DSM 13165]|uniref:CRISPR-associated exonuclease Cas4 n=1 Tax=Ignicoccus islandicus DSM 13165 TaxID=940295 RepID=A0A0U2U8Z3_9CREN|nr:CRISPR-associated protein Cas4 [Ignicoccus islandicus]ALU12548.1 hypothetical protein EYM_05050 [Ignicoccus islandicus DSM 13165]
MKKGAVRGNALRVRPSDLRTMAFCPRLLFFEVHVPRERGIAELLRLYAGKVWHFLIELFSEGEDEVAAEGAFGGALLKGRADLVRDDAIVEIKSGRGPREGVWYGDFLQASAYAFVLGKRKIVIKYRDKEVEMALKENHEIELVEAIKLLKMIIEGYLPPPKRNSWCSKCPYREFCDALGEEGDDWFPKLPWVKTS